MEISDPDQFQALGHPLRHRLLFTLGQHEATISQLATELGIGKGSVAHHLGVLADAGLVRVVRTRQVRGGTEQYYRRTAAKLRFVGPYSKATTEVALRAVAQEIAGAVPDPLFVLRNLRLTQRQADELAATLQNLVEGTEDAGPALPRYGLLVALYRPEAPGVTGADDPS